VREILFENRVVDTDREPRSARVLRHLSLRVGGQVAECRLEQLGAHRLCAQALADHEEPGVRTKHEAPVLQRLIDDVRPIPDTMGSRCLCM